MAEWPEDEQNEDQRNRRQRAFAVAARFMPGRGRGIGPAGPRQVIVQNVIEQTGGAAGPDLPEGVPPPLPAECIENLRGRRSGNYGTILYLRNPNRQLWFGGGAIAVSADAAVQPLEQTGYSPEFQEIVDRGRKRTYGT